jgi:D-alanine transaminase
MSAWCCVNGRYGPIDEATVPINDRGFLFGDSVYEVFHVHDGRLWAAERHYRRLGRSLEAIGLNADLEAIRGWVDETLRQSRLAEAMVYLHVTRGVAPRNHAFPPDLKPTVVITVRPLVAMPEAERRRGVKAITVPEVRWRRRDIKSTNLLPNVLAKQQAIRAGAYEALFVEADGTVNEGSSTNVFLVRDGALHTPAKGPQILPGITRDLLVETAREQGYAVEERTVKLSELFEADEVFLSGTTTEALGVVEVDSRRIADGQVGLVTRGLFEAYSERVRQGRD